MGIALTAHDCCKPYRGQGLAEHFGGLLSWSDAKLRSEGEKFLQVMATWVYRKFSGRREGEVPLGHLSRFVLPDDTEIKLTQALMVQIVRTLRRRGLREYDENDVASPHFNLLVRAYDRVQGR